MFKNKSKKRINIKIIHRYLDLYIIDILYLDHIFHILSYKTLGLIYSFFEFYMVYVSILLLLMSNKNIFLFLRLVMKSVSKLLLL